MQKENMRCAQRTVGRLFSKDGRLHMVLEADSHSGFAKVSCRLDDGPRVIDMSVGEVIKHLSSSTLKLDGLSAEGTEERVIERDNRWYFKAREGEQGPFADQETAKRALRHYILSAQEEGRTGRPAQAMSG